jgi:hypothetical protein
MLRVISKFAYPYLYFMLCCTLIVFAWKVIEPATECNLYSWRPHAAWLLTLLAAEIYSRKARKMWTILFKAFDNCN